MEITNKDLYKINLKSVERLFGQVSFESMRSGCLYKNFLNGIPVIATPYATALWAPDLLGHIGDEHVYPMLDDDYREVSEGFLNSHAFRLPSVIETACCLKENAVQIGTAAVMADLRRFAVENGRSYRHGVGYVLRSELSDVSRFGQIGERLFDLRLLRKLVPNPDTEIYFTPSDALGPYGLRAHCYTHVGLLVFYLAFGIDDGAVQVIEPHTEHLVINKPSDSPTL